jgi:hypothetical protein
VSEKTVWTTTWICDLCGDESGEKVACLFYPAKTIAAVTVTSLLPSYERMDICASCVMHYHISDALAWFRRREG